MAKEIKKEKLKDVTGGDYFSDVTKKISYNCQNKKCGKTFKHSEAVFKDGKVYCPYCGTCWGYIDDIG